MKIALAFLGLCMALPASAQQVCPPNPDHEAAKDSILQDLRVSRDETESRILSNGLWRLWTDAPDSRAQELLDEGMRRRQSSDFLGARDVLDGLVDYCPDYAEGYNQRAFASFLSQDYAAALTDLERALEIDPRHVAALTGMALTLMGLERDDEAQLVLREALRMNPWLGERRLLTLPPEQAL